MTHEHTGVTVVGIGTVRVPSTEATVRLRIERRAPQPGIALRDAGGVVATAFDVLRGLGIPERDVRTDSVTVSPNRVWANDIEQIQGYDATQTVQVRVTDLSLLDELLGRLVHACGTAMQIDDVSLTGEPTTEARSQARADAVRDAHEKASEYARLVDRALGRAVSVSEVSGTSLPSPPPGRRMAMAAPMPTAGGEQTNRVTVEIHWEFE